MVIASDMQTEKNSLQQHYPADCSGFLEGGSKISTEYVQCTMYLHSELKKKTD